MQGSEAAAGCGMGGRDDSLAQSLVPSYDHRIPLAMEYHGVSSCLLKPRPTATELTPNISPSQKAPAPPAP